MIRLANLCAQPLELLAHRVRHIAFSKRLALSHNRRVGQPSNQRTFVVMVVLIAFENIEVEGNGLLRLALTARRAAAQSSNTSACLSRGTTQ